MLAITHKTKDRVTRTSLKLGVNSGARITKNLLWHNLAQEIYHTLLNGVQTT